MPDFGIARVASCVVDSFFQRLSATHRVCIYIDHLGSDAFDHRRDHGVRR